MTPDSRVEDVFFAFTAEPDMAPETLRTYILRYPDLAEALTDLYHEFATVDLDLMVVETAPAAEPAFEQTADHIERIEAALSGDGLRALARALRLPRDFVAGFRDAQVRPGSIPLGVLKRLGDFAGVGVLHMLAYFRHAAGIRRALAFKSDHKPKPSEIMDYSDFVRNLGLTSEEAFALAELEHSDGSD
ncbi:MAG: hypothetical protein KKC43_17270 [Alphaproteobacteria bacterium]|nr:hypothetical protein [Alphaproteobacteria bacterium]